MYNRIKNIARKIISKRFLFHHEPKIRFLIYQLYRGKKFECNICHKLLRKFISTHDDKLCPYCGSISRNRRLWQLLNKGYIRANISVLDFSPSRCIYRLQKKNSNIQYSSTDLSGDFLSDHHFDITHIEKEDGAYDLIVCYHILEHVEDDLSAMRELNRVLKEKGFCIIQTPFKEGETYENPSIVSKEDRRHHFGQDDHVRIYSILGLSKRLKDCGFEVEVKNFDEDPDNLNGFSVHESVLICTKKSIF